MEIDLEQVQVVHNPAENRFETWVNGNLSTLDYVKNGRNFIIMHVGVHPSLRGRGVAGRIVKAGLEYARENSYRVVAMCSYAAAYIRRHPDYARLTAQGADE